MNGVFITAAVVVASLIIAAGVGIAAYRRASRLGRRRYGRDDEDSTKQ